MFVFYWLLNMSLLGGLMGLPILLLRRLRRMPRFVSLWLIPFAMTRYVTSSPAEPIPIPQAAPSAKYTAIPIIPNPLLSFWKSAVT